MPANSEYRVLKAAQTAVVSWFCLRPLMLSLQPEVQIQLTGLCHPACRVSQKSGNLAVEGSVNCSGSGIQSVGLLHDWITCMINVQSHTWTDPMHRPHSGSGLQEGPAPLI